MIKTMHLNTVFVYSSLPASLILASSFFLYVQIRFLHDHSAIIFKFVPLWQMIEPNDP